MEPSLMRAANASSVLPLVTTLDARADAMESISY